MTYVCALAQTYHMSFYSCSCTPFILEVVGVYKLECFWGKQVSPRLVQLTGLNTIKSHHASQLHLLCTVTGAFQEQSKQRFIANTGFSEQFL